MEKKSTNIAIIGAGVSGLIAAITLEEQGYSPTIYEASDRVGGRVKTDIIDGYQLDHGFQVLLDAYPCLLYTSPSPRDRTRSRMPSSA